MAASQLYAREALTISQALQQLDQQIASAYKSGDQNAIKALMQGRAQVYEMIPKGYR
jgi:hypothetical protein